MTDVLKMSRKALTVGVVLTTIAWSMMATILVAPLKASAAGCTGGTLIKGSLSAVYYCGGDGKRYVFTNDKAYFTWYSDFSGVMKLADSDLAAIQIGGNVTYRPGVKMLKIQSDPKVYAIAKNGTLRPIASEAVASCLYGSTWNKQIDDVSDAFFTNYTVGTAISACSDFNKSAEMSGAATINGDKNLGGSVSSGQITAALASDNPAAATIPSKATSVNVLKFTVTNGGSSAATVDSLTVHRSGAGKTSDISALYVYDGATRLTTGRTVNSSTNDASFSSLGLMLNAGETHTLWIAMTSAASPGAGDVHMFSVTAATAGSATVGGLPLNGNAFTMSSAVVGSLTISKTGSITNPKVGQQNVDVAEFQLAAGSDEDVWVNRITLFQAGNLSTSNISNLKLEQAGNVLATASGLDAKEHATFNLAAPLKLEKGATKTFDVYADIGGSARSGDTIKLYVEEDADLYGTGATFGYGVSVVRTTYDGDSCTSSAGDCSYSSVEGGQITLTFNGPSSQNYASNGKDKELFNFTMASQGNVEVRKLTLTIACGTATAGNGGCKKDSDSSPNYTDIKVTNKATGQVWWGPQDLSGTGSDSSQVLTFTEVQTLAAGSSQTFSVSADIKSTVPATDTIKATLTAFGTSDLRNLDNSTFVATTDIVPSGDIAGNSMTILAPSLAASLASTPVSQTFVSGSAAVPYLGLNLKAGDGGDIKVTTLTLTGYMDQNVDATFAQGKEASGNAVSDVVLSCGLWDGSNQVGTSKSPTTSASTGTGGLLQFTNMNLTVAASQTKSLLLKCDTSNSAPFGGTDDAVSFALVTPSSDLTAQDPDGNNVTATGAVNGTTSPTVAVTTTTSGSMAFVKAPDDTESQAGLVVAGGQNVVLGKYRLTASKEDLKVVKLTAFVGNTQTRSLTSLSLYDGSTLLAGPVSLTTGASGTAQFSGMTFVVPKDSSKTITLKGSLNTIPSGAKTGDDLKASLYLPGTATSDTTSLEIRGTSSSTVIRQQPGANTQVDGNSKLVRKTIPTVSTASLPTTVLTNGGGVVAARFTVTADAAEQVSIKKVSFKVAVSNFSSSSTDIVSTPALREVGQGSDLSTASAVAATTGTSCGFAANTGNYCVTLVFTNEQVISAGTSKTYELRLTTSGFATSDSMSTTTLGDSVDAVGELEGAAGPGTGIDALATGTNGTYNFLWSDNDKVPHNDTIATNGNTVDDATASNDWMNGNLVKVLPADAQTLTR